MIPFYCTVHIYLLTVLFLSLYVYSLGSINTKPLLSPITHWACLQTMHLRLHSGTMASRQHPKYKVSTGYQTHGNHKEYVMRYIRLGILNCKMTSHLKLKFLYIISTSLLYRRLVLLWKHRDFASSFNVKMLQGMLTSRRDDAIDFDIRVYFNK